MFDSDPTIPTESGEGRRVAVVGGSLGGLTAANLLREAGWSVDVFERSARPLDGRGAGIVVHDATVRYPVIRRGVDIETISCASSFIRHLDPSGEIVHEAPSPYRFTAWNSLYQALLAPMEGRYHLDHEVRRVEPGPESSELVFATGSSDSYHLVVAADGFDSTVRRQLFPSVEAEYSGYVGWRGVVRESELSPATFELLSDSITYCVLPNSHIVAYPIPTTDGAVEVGQRLINYVWYRNVDAGPSLDELMTDIDGERRAVSLHPGRVRQPFIDELRSAATELSPALTEVVTKTAEPFLQVIVDVESPALVEGTVAIMGDGAFSARPHAAAGTAKAAEDAWRLVEELAAQDDVGAALRCWEQTQMELGQKLVARARQIGERSQFHNTWVPGDPELAFGLYGPGS